MGLTIPRLLIPEERLGRAGKLRIGIGLVAVTLGLGACRQGWGGGTYSFVGMIMGGALLIIFSLGALRWRRERGLWMVYIFQACLAIFMYTIMLPAPGIAWSFPGSPAPARPPNPRMVAAAWDAAIGGWVVLMNLRLQLSAAVANHRRFGPPPGNAAHRP